MCGYVCVGLVHICGGGVCACDMHMVLCMCDCTQMKQLNAKIFDSGFSFFQCVLGCRLGRAVAQRELDARIGPAQETDFPLARVASV